MVFTMSDVPSAASQEAPNLEVMLRLMSGEIVNPVTYREFNPREMGTLSRVYRFGAQIDYTVQDHINLGLMLSSDKDQQRWWILHESAEALSGQDIQKPLKQTWPWYIEFENNYLEFVYGYHGLDFSLYESMVGELDVRCFEIEEAHFFKGSPQSSIILTLDEYCIPLDQQVMKLFPEIYGDRNE